MPSVAGMGLEFSCGEDPKLVPAVATGAEQHGAAPEEFVEIMTAALKDAKYGTRPTPKVTLEALKQKGWRPPAIAIPPATPGTSPGGKRGVTWRVAAERAARSGYLTSPRSVHVCMELGVDPATLLERDLASFAEKGLSETLQAAAHAHHEEVRAKTLARLLEARAALPANFQPPSVGVDKLSKSFKMNATPGENSADAEMRARQLEEEAKRAKQREKMEANRKQAEAETQKLQREFAEKTTRTEARARVLSKKMLEQERARTAEQVRRTAEQTRQAAVYESDERAAALKRVDEETAARKAAARAAALEKKAEAARRAESAARVAARAAKTAAIRARAEAQTEALRLQLEARDAKLAEFENATARRRGGANRGPGASARVPPSVSRNLSALASEEEQRRRELVRERLRRDARAMSARMSEDDLEARAARDVAAAAKRAKAETARLLETESRAASFASAEAKQAARMRTLASARAAESERVRFERALKASERARRVQNLSRARAVEKARLLRKLEEDASRTETFTSTRASLAESRQLENCRAALAKSTRQQREEEAMRKETRERWLKSQEPDLELEARIAAEAEEKARAAAEAKAAEKAAAAARVAAKHKRSASQVSAYSQKSEKRSQVSGGSRAHSTAGSARDGGVEVDAGAEAEVDAEIEFRRERNVEDGEGGSDSGDGDDSAPAFVAAEGAEAPVEGTTDAPVDGEAAEEAPAAVDEPEAADVDDEDTVAA